MSFPLPETYVVVFGINPNTVSHNLVWNANDPTDAMRQAMNQLSLGDVNAIIGVRAIKVVDMPPVPLTPEEANA